MSRSPTSPISVRLIPLRDKPFFDFLGNRWGKSEQADPFAQLDLKSRSFHWESRSEQAVRDSIDEPEKPFGSDPCYPILMYGYVPAFPIDRSGKPSKLTPVLTS